MTYPGYYLQLSSLYAFFKILFVGGRGGGGGGVRRRRDQKLRHWEISRRQSVVFFRFKCASSNGLPPVFLCNAKSPLSQESVRDF